MVSNANGTLHAHMRRLGLAPYFELMLDSREEGIEKPDPMIFARALQRSGAEARSTLHVGDLYHVDVLGARAAGIEAWLLDAGDLYRDVDCRRIRSLEELAERLALR
jgi:putative hydrolase of the HAD superfamily